MSTAWTCERCGETHTGLPDIGISQPDLWLRLTDEERARSRLDADTCEINADDGSSFFVRGVLELPLVDADGTFGYGVWGSLSESHFRRFLELYDDPERVDEPPYFSWLSNRLAGWPETLNLKTNVEIFDIASRPRIVLEPTDHPLARAQYEGIAFRRALELVEPHLHQTR
jgi:hypothetical protein